MVRSLTKAFPILVCLAACFAVSCNPIGQSKSVEVEATVLIVQKAPVDVFGGNTAPHTYLEDHVATQMVLIRTPAIIGRAIRMPNLKDLGLKTDSEAVMAICDALTVTRHGEPKDFVFTITWKGTNPNHGTAILEAVLSSYQGFLDETYKSVSDRTLDLILAAQRTLSHKLQQAEQELQDFHIRNRLMVFGRDHSKLRFEALTAFEAKKSAVLASIAGLEGRLAWAEKAINDKNESVGLLLKVNEWATRTGFDKLPKEARQGLEAPQAYISYLKQELAENRSIEKSLNQLIEGERTRLTDFSNYEFQDERLRNTVTSNRALFDSIVKRVNEVNLVKDFGGYEARVVSPPHVKK